MVAIGVSFGIVLGKEFFGGTGMNILNPALTCRAFLYFAYPNKMSGNVWVGSDPLTLRESLLKMNQEGNLSGLDAVSNATYLPTVETQVEIKRMHVEAISSMWSKLDSSFLSEKLSQFSQSVGQHLSFGSMSLDQVKQFVTSPMSQGGLALPADIFADAYNAAQAKLGMGIFSDWNLFLGNQLGSLGETSTLACILGAIILVVTGIGSWRSMLGVIIGSYITGLLFQLGSHMGTNEGMFNAAVYDFAAYKHFIVGGLAFGLVFMATDPVSSPSMRSAKWAYGILIGMVTVVIRLVNPAFSEGVMLAILFGNVLAPLLDQVALKHFTRGRRVNA